LGLCNLGLFAVTVTENVTLFGHVLPFVRL
jgi:hypothetical protein